jgi:long-chain acyl-CoA synthetase
VQTIPQYLAGALDGPNRESAFREKLGASSWSATSSHRMRERATAIAYAIARAGIGAGDRVALVANNSVNWLAADFGIFFSGCVIVPIFATLAPDQLAFILRDSGAKLCFVEHAAQATRLRAVLPDAPRTIVFDFDGPDSLAAFEAGGAAAAAEDPSALASFTHGTKSADLAVLIYTSGTTGNPKGVMLTHDNLVSNAEAAIGLLPADMRDGGTPVLSVLPFAHIYEHTLINTFTKLRAEIAITQPNFLLDDLKTARPRCMALVPRIFERVLAGIVGKAKLEGGLKARLVPWALGVGREYLAATQDGGKSGAPLALQFAIARKLVLAKIKPAIGLDRLEFFISGSAPLHRDIALTFAAMGIPVVEGYGLTETSPIVTGSHVDAIRYGSVGKPIPGVDVKIASDGEILVKGPNVMRGYYNLPEERPFTEDGYFMTGDIGEFDRDGYLFITDRKKELIKTSAGKYVAPGRVEAALKRSIYVGQCFVIGDGRAHPIALVAPNWDLIRKEFDIPADATTVAIAARADVLDFVQKEVVANSADLASFESVRRIALLPRDLTIEDGELSPTLKIKRRIVAKKYAELIESAYAKPVATKG